MHSQPASACKNILQGSMPLSVLWVVILSFCREIKYHFQLEMLSRGEHVKAKVEFNMQRMNSKNPYKQNACIQMEDKGRLWIKWQPKTKSKEGKIIWAKPWVNTNQMSGWMTALGKLPRKTEWMKWRTKKKTKIWCSMYSYCASKACWSYQLEI